MVTLDLFGDASVTNVQTQEAAASAAVTWQRASPEERAKRRISAVLDEGHVVVVAFSAGKDSSCLAALVLNTASERIAAGLECPPILVTHSNTGVEQPEIVELAFNEVSKMRKFAHQHGIELQVLVGEPLLGDSFPVRVIGGRALPSFPDSRADCSTNWKIDVNERLVKKAIALSASMQRWKEAVVMTGVRQGESVARDIRIRARGESVEGIWRNEMGHMRVSPIIDWEVDDVWEFIGLCAAGVIPSYSDFADTMRIYRDSGGSSCVIVADMKKQAAAAPCGARTGCWSCTRVRVDHSMTQMMASDPQRYGYLRPLARLRDFISATQYDWSRRAYVGRTIDKDGYIEVGADSYSASMVRELLVYALTAQMRSGVKIISTAQLIAIDAKWSQYAMWPPFTAIKTYFEVMSGGAMEAPEVQAFPKTPVPKLGKIHVGQDWIEVHGKKTVAGLRDLGMEIFHESCGSSLRQLASGALVLDVESEGSLEIDEEAAADFLGVFADEYVEAHCRDDHPNWTEGFKIYLQLGLIEIPKGQSQQTDKILRRSQWRQEQGLHGQPDINTLIERLDVRYGHQQSLL
ncbi:phosphoadenosine phosphosulfate reductase family protein [Acidovorax sp.]|uniref:phosphoadenosine phosphosulfate reductase domain-containing protein n=1 Tax=Acidovorax sp. TaxID=1872122 RepID=UPI0025C63B38|nr:phosphoadenosine phosphosulfate reductase family protein [Acidovorax sp.]